MSIEVFFLILLILIAIGALIYWLLITTEGVYLGRRVVVWLYDVYARRYDGIKNYDSPWESATLARPILHALIDIPAPMILDVATGTARLPLTLFDQPVFNGYVIGLDYSRKMLGVAAEKVVHIGHRIDLVYQSAQQLPFADNTFDAVTCLEALEFMPDPDAVIAELVRVARPGALILITNRKGLDARLMPGKTWTANEVLRRLTDDHGLEEARVIPWQIDYDQVWSYKPGALTPAPDHGMEAVLLCPTCKQATLIRTESSLLCADCETRIPIGADGVIEYAR